MLLYLFGALERHILILKYIIFYSFQDVVPFLKVPFEIILIFEIHFTMGTGMGLLCLAEISPFPGLNGS